MMDQKIQLDEFPPNDPSVLLKEREGDKPQSNSYNVFSRRKTVFLEISIAS